MNDESLPVTETEAAPTENSQKMVYEVSQDGLLVKFKGKNGEMQQMWLCSELRVEACTRDDQQAGWGRLLAFSDTDGHVHRYNALMCLLSGSGDAVIAELMDRGLLVSQSQGAKKLIISYLLHTQPAARARTVKMTGWHGDQYVLPEQVIGSGSETLLYQQDFQASHAYRTQGTLLEWQLQVARYCIGNSRLVLAVSTAFASTLLGIINGESGGVSITGGSSTGKTTALFVATSVCGAPEFLLRWRSTSNGLESVAMQHNDNLLILDELAQIDPREAGETAYMLANGAGKIRATRSGGAKGKASWRLLFLSAGEVSLAEHMAAAGKIARAGQEIRLVDVPADAGKGLGLFENLHGHATGAQFSEALKLSGSRFYGTALVEFLSKLTAEDTYIINKQIDEFQQLFLSSIDLGAAGGQARRVAGRFALIAAGGELASSLGVTGWEAGEAINAAVVCFNAWVESREGTGQQEHKRMLEQVCEFIERHGDCRFSPFNDATTTKTINRAGFRKLEPFDDAYTYYILPNVWREEVCKGFNQKVMAEHLLASGVLVPGANNKPYSTVRLPSMGSAKCYVVNGSAMAQAETATVPSMAGNTGNACNVPWVDEEIPF